MLTRKPDRPQATELQPASDSSSLAARRDSKIDGAILTRTGLEFTRKLSLAEWHDIGEFLSRAESGLQWWIGDWLLYGESRPEWGDGYEQAISRFNRDYETILKYKAVAAKIEFSNRLPNLSWTHHFAVAYESLDDRSKLLIEAEANNWSVSELRKAVRERRPKPESPPLPESKFNLIYADPPWRYDDCPTESRKIENHYPTMDLDDICSVCVQQIAADDCVLFLWATSPKLQEALQVVDAWGFEYRTCMVWRKDKIGMGYYARQQHELLLICRLGNAPVPEESTRPPSVIDAPREEHSRKPDVFYELIERMYPSHKRVELFARRPRDGWYCWGNEAEDKGRSPQDDSH